MSNPNQGWQTSPPPFPQQPPGEPDHRATVTMRRGVLASLSLLVVGATAVAAGLIGYTIGKDRDRTESVVASTVTLDAPLDPSSSTTSQAPSERSRIGAATTNGAAAVTLTGVTTPSSLDFYKSDFEATKPRTGSRYVLAELKVTNNGRKPVSPLYAVDVRLTDGQGREFSVVDDNFSIRQNFGRTLADEMPDDLQPGLSTQVYYAFEIPVGTTIEAFGYRDDAASDDDPWTEYSVTLR